MAMIEEINLGADQLGSFHTKVGRFMSRCRETYITDVIDEPADPETVEVVVYGSRGTTLLVVLTDQGWISDEFLFVEDEPLRLVEEKS
jgi:hypothetical protein